MKEKTGEQTIGDIPNYESRLHQIDWNREWKYARDRTSSRKQCPDITAFWNKMAMPFDRFDNGARTRAKRLIDRLGVGPDTTIIDVGCGTGKMAILLAQHAHHVTAIDPAEAMLARLEEKAEQANLGNIVTLQKKWEDVTVGVDLAPHDIVLASRSLIMDDLQGALSKMIAAAKDWICLFWFAGRVTFGYGQLWPRLFGESYIAGPDHMLVLNILHQMNIYPNVSISKQTHVQQFDSLEEATEYWAGNVNVSSPAQYEIIRRWVEETLIPEDGYMCSKRDVRSSMIWWRKE